MNWLKLIGCFLIASLQAQTPVLDISQNTLYTIQDGQLIDPTETIRYTNQGNILFKGDSKSYKKIQFTLALDSFSQKKGAVIYNGKGAESKFYIENSQIYYTLNKEKHLTASILKDADNWTIYDGLTDSLLAFIPNTEVSEAMVFAVYQALWTDKNLEEALRASLAVKETVTTDGLAYIEPVFGGGVVWVWDGKYLFPYGANLNHPMVWVFENDKLGPRNYPRNQEEWSWDGSSLKPYWGGNPQGQWSWQNGVLRQVWNNNHNNEYFIDETTVRKRFGVYGDNEWELTGDVPLPIITAVILGYLYR